MGWSKFCLTCNGKTNTTQTQTHTDIALSTHYNGDSGRFPCAAVSAAAGADSAADPVWPAAAAAADVAVPAGVGVGAAGAAGATGAGPPAAGTSPVRHCRPNHTDAP